MLRPHIVSPESVLDPLWLLNSFLSMSRRNLTSIVQILRTTLRPYSNDSAGHQRAIGSTSNTHLDDLGGQ